MATETNPSFIKVLLGGQFSNKLAIPSAFLHCFNGRVPRRCSLQTRGRTWFVDVEKVNHKYYFQLGWSDFVQDNGLQSGEFVVFHYAGNSHFHVEMFGRNTCKKLHVTPDQMEETNEDDDVSLEVLDDFPPCPRKTEEKSLLSSSLSLKRKKASSSGKADTTLNFRKRLPHLEKSAMKKKEPHWFRSKMISDSDYDSGDEDDDHDEEDEYDSKYDEEEETEDEDKDEEDDDDDSVEILNESPRCSRTVGKYTLASRLNKRKRKSYTAEAKTKIKAVGGLPREETFLQTKALHRANTFKSNSDNPCFVVFLSATYARGIFLNLPRIFTKKHLTNPQPGSVTLRVKKSSWSLKVNYYGTTARLGAGWSAFVQDNNLKFGDACVFVLTNAIKHEFQVEIFGMTAAVRT